MRDNNGINWLVQVLIAVFVLAACTCIVFNLLGKWGRGHMFG